MTTPTIKSVETRYKNYRFRSRLEARWAVFFDIADIPWEYEPQGYVIDGRPYLPDFLLTECQTWIEVKGEFPTQPELDFLTSASTQLPGGMILLGPIPNLPNPINYDVVWKGPMGDAYGFGHYHKNHMPWWYSHTWYTNGFHEYNRDHLGMSSQVADAYLGARSARFEHGEIP